jgi:hypothetical protein
MPGIIRVFLISLLIILPAVCKPQEEFPKSVLYKNFQEKRAGSILPDYSYVGYHDGEKSIPNPVWKIFGLTKFGAIPNDDISDKEAIRKAIVAAEANRGGIVLFPKGRFLINEDNDTPGSIIIKSGNIILRGSGSGNETTELFMKNALRPEDTTKMWTSPSMFVFGDVATKKRIGVITQKAKIGTFKIVVNSGTQLKNGDWIELELKSTDSELIKSELGNHALEKEWKFLIDQGLSVKVIHQILAIQHDTIMLKEPLTYDINPANKWSVSKMPNIQEVGIENITFSGNWKKKFVHHRSWIDDSGWTMIKLKQIANSWIRNCVFKDVNVAVMINSGANISVFNCHITGNGGHEAITNSGGTNIFFGKIIDEASAWHSVGVAGTSMNTVIWRIRYPSTSSFESHSSQPRNTLLDCVEGGLLYNRGGGSKENMPNHMQNLVLWNFKQTNEAYEKFDFWPVKPWYWRIPYPIVVGFHGTKTQFISEQLKYSESIGKQVEPESLYEAQLKLRLGMIPDWLIKLKL